MQYKIYKVSNENVVNCDGFKIPFLKKNNLPNEMVAKCIYKIIINNYSIFNRTEFK